MRTKNYILIKYVFIYKVLKKGKRIPILHKNMPKKIKRKLIWKQKNN
jgi:hypothetical protein